MNWEEYTQKPITLAEDQIEKEKTEKQRQGNDYKDFNDIPTEDKKPVYNPESSYMGGMFNYPNKPKYDKNRQAYLKSLSKATNIGNMLALLGDVAGVAVGGNVQKRNTNSIKPYIQSFIDYNDKYQDRLEDWDNNNFLNNIREMSRIQSQSNADRAFAASQTNADRNYELAKDKYEDNKEQTVFENSLRRRNQELSEKEANSRIAYNRSRTDKLRPDSNKPYMKLELEPGKQIEISEGQFRRLYQEAVKYFENSDTPIKGITGDEQQQRIGQEEAVAKYLIELHRLESLNKIKNDPALKRYTENQVNDYLNNTGIDLKSFGASTPEKKSTTYSTAGYY